MTQSSFLGVALFLSLSVFVVSGSDPLCVYPGTCTPPEHKYSLVADITPRRQWGNSGGYCGSLSVQSIALSYGTWISQDLVRKSTVDGGGHGSPADGWEILHTNIEQALETLKFDFESWDYEGTPLPQGQAYLTWLKNNLVSGNPVVWFIMCKGDSHNTYGLATYDHIEPVWGIYSNHVLTDGEVYDDDVVQHGSDWEPDGTANLGYFRPFSSLLDTVAMDGNCAEAQAGWGKNEMYPCVDQNITYATAMTGPTEPIGSSLPLSLAVDCLNEPDLASGVAPVGLHGTVTVRELTPGAQYVLYRWDSTDSVPVDGRYEDSAFDYRTPFTAPPAGEGSEDGLSSYVFQDPVTFLSSGATYYRCAAAEEEQQASE